MGITHAEVLGVLQEGLDLFLGVVGSIWNAVGVIDFRYGFNDMMINTDMWL